MFIFFLISLVNCMLKPLQERDLNIYDQKSKDLAAKPFLVFLYYEKRNFQCPTCIQFKEFLNNVDFDIRSLNFADNVKLGSRFLQHTFPAFIIRHNQKSYPLNPKTPEELQQMLVDNAWLHVKPVKSIVDVNSKFVVLFSYVNPIIFKGIDFFYFLRNNISDQFVTVFILGVMTYLIYSIIEVFKSNPVKVKSE